VDIQCLQCGGFFAAEPTAPARCPHCGWRRKALDPAVGAPAGESFASGVSCGCLISVLLLAIAFFLLFARVAPWRPA
jgi:hypothetical protein